MKVRITEKHRENLSKTHMGIRMTEQAKDKLRALSGDKSHNWRGGKPKCSDCGVLLKSIYAKKCVICRGISKRGENHPNWKGGISVNVHSTSEPRYRLWREMVFGRDKYTCKECGIRGVYLEAHHKKSWARSPELRYIIDNGITLCKECHSKTDDYRGRNRRKK